MKKILFALSFLMFAGVAVNAQSTKTCSKKASAKCCASKKGATTSAETTTTTRVASAMTEADVAAEADENITTRVCGISGTKSYYQKSVCEQSGKVAWDEVKYCGQSKKFTKVASASMEKDVQTGEVKNMEAKKQCTKGAKACKKTCTAKKKATS